MLFQNFWWLLLKRTCSYSQFTRSVIRLLTAGGTSFEAMQRNAPICRRSTRHSGRELPTKLSAENNDMFQKMPIAGKKWRRCVKECPDWSYDRSLHLRHAIAVERRVVWPTMRERRQFLPISGQALRLSFWRARSTWDVWSKLVEEMQYRHSQRYSTVN